MAVAHSMLITIYHILKDGVAFQDLGADYYNQFNKERKISAYLKRLKALGWEIPGDMGHNQPNHKFFRQKNLVIGGVCAFLPPREILFHSKFHFCL